MFHQNVCFPLKPKVETPTSYKSLAVLDLFVGEIEGEGGEREGRETEMGRDKGRRGGERG